MITFEALLALVEKLPQPLCEEERQVQWVEAHQLLGMSRQPGGGIEIFLCGDELRTTSPLIKRHLKYDCWTRSGGDEFRANRLVLPSQEYYVPTAAFISEELLRCDIVRSITAAFAQTEPLIEMVLRRTALSEDEILGLLGELRFLEALLAVAPDRRARARAVDSWRGHERGTRDFIVGSCGVEVKSTRGERSRHRISNVMQVDPRGSSNGEAQEELYLLSMGFKAGENFLEGAGFSLPGTVDSILSKLANSQSSDELGELQTLFLEKVSRYGGGVGRGYEHQEMKNWSAYQGRWQHSFTRIYDMTDTSIKVLRRADIQHCYHVVLDSLGFDIDLPDVVSGELNPQSDLFALARRFLSD